MQMSRSALLAADCYVTREFRVLLIVIAETFLRKEIGCAGYVTMGVNTKKAACSLVSNLQQIVSGLPLI